MTYHNQLNTDLSNEFFKPVFDVYSRSVNFLSLINGRFILSMATIKNQLHLIPNTKELTNWLNEGVESDHLVRTSNGVQLRRIVYKNPKDGKIYTYLTNDITLPAGILVLLYKHRWDQEKVFDVLKNKMEERKSWASTDTAKQAHAIFECLTHNLLLLLEERVINEEGLIDECERKKDLGRKREGSPERLRLKKEGGNMVNTAIVRATQRKQRFIRWVRTRIYINLRVPWSHSVARLATIWGMKIE